MITTPELIRLLVADVEPVGRLRPPLLRAGIWVAAASVVLALVAIGTTVIGAFAVAGLTVSALRLFYDLDATIMVLIWNVGAGAAISAAVALFGRPLLLSSIWSTGPRGRLPA